MDPVSQDVALKFCQLCDWAYETWVTHRLLFDDNNAPERNIGKAVAFTNRLSAITQEYCLQQIAKLHDPAVQGKSLNLTIDYIVRFGDWGEQRHNVEEIHANLQDLWERLKLARNKTLAHNDLESVMADAVIGAFPEGADDNYFDTLQTLVNEVHQKWLGAPYPFNDLAGNDTQEFLLLLERA
jgi:AbiU2